MRHIANLVLGEGVNAFSQALFKYIAQYGDPYGIFAEDTAKKNRDSVKKFIKLPNDYELGSDS